MNEKSWITKVLSHGVGEGVMGDDWPNVIHGSGSGSPDWDVINNGFSGG